MIAVLLSSTEENDRTHFTYLKQRYLGLVEMILNGGHPSWYKGQEGLLSRFQRIYSTAYICRYPQCINSEHGFRTRQDRDSHEMVHWKRLSCGESTCEFYASGFMSRASLLKHNRKYHFQQNVKDIPQLGLANPNHSLSPRSGARYQAGKSSRQETATPSSALDISETLSAAHESVVVAPPTLKFDLPDEKKAITNNGNVQADTLLDLLRHIIKTLLARYRYMPQNVVRFALNLECSRFVSLVDDYKNNPSIGDRLDKVAKTLRQDKDRFWMEHQEWKEGAILVAWRDRASKISEILGISMPWCFLDREQGSIQEIDKMVRCGGCYHFPHRFLNTLELLHHMVDTHDSKVELRDVQVQFTRSVTVSNLSKIPGYKTPGYSYWSEPGQDEFLMMLGWYGTDWESISSLLKKSVVTLKDSYKHLVAENPEFEYLTQIVDEARSGHRESVGSLSLLEASKEIVPTTTNILPGLTEWPGPRPQLMDHLTFSPNVLGSSMIFEQLPPHIKTWAELKKWTTDKALAGLVSAEMLMRLEGLQRIHFCGLLERRQQDGEVLTKDELRVLAAQST